MHYMFTMNPKTFIYRKGVNLIISWQCQNKYNEKDTACDDEECPIYDNRIIHTFLEHSVVSWLRTGIAEKQSVPPSSRGYDNYSEGISIHFNKILKITSQPVCSLLIILPSYTREFQHLIWIVFHVKKNPFKIAYYRVIISVKTIYKINP